MEGYGFPAWHLNWCQPSVASLCASGWESAWCEFTGETEVTVQTEKCGPIHTGFAVWPWEAHLSLAIGTAGEVYDPLPMTELRGKAQRVSPPLQ